MIRLRGAALAAIVLALTAPPALAGDAVVLDDAGWWFHGSGSPLSDVPIPVDDPLAPTPPESADGELVVAASEGDPVAIAAVRFSLPPGANALRLSMPVSRAEGEGNIVACVAGSSWTGESGGEWAEKPQADCESGSVIAGPVTDGSLQIDVSGLQVVNSVDLVLVPGEGADLEVVFAPPDGSDLEATLRDVDQRSGGSPPPAGRGGAALPSSGISSSGGIRLPDPPSSPAAIALAPEDTGKSATSPIEQATTSRALDDRVAVEDQRSSRAATGPVGRVVAALVGASALGYWFLNGRTPNRAGPRGLGDFRTERARPPLALR